MRLLRIDWSGFACTKDWYWGRGALGHLLHETYMPYLKAVLERPLVYDLYATRSEVD